MTPDLARMSWARKAVSMDGTTRNGFRWPVGVGGWVTQDVPDEARDGSACGVGLHLGLTAAGLSSAHRLSESILLCVGWLPEDEIARDAHKVRVQRCWVLPDVMAGMAAVLRDGWGVGANLYGANLLGANLPRANLFGANLYGANLYGANLSGANLSRANLFGANLYGANLSGADLFGANLYGADLFGANLSGAYLSRAYLLGANLYGANLSGAYLSGADLSRAYLLGANLSGADLFGACANRGTRWPHGFDPESKGVVVR